MGKKSKKKVEQREVKYEKFAVKSLVGEKAMTVAAAKKTLGWEEETEKVKFGDNFLLKDLDGTKIRCTNNVTNRPLYRAVYDTLKQEHLRRRWRLNGEPIIIGKTGLVLNGQHTLISLILAAQEWENDPEKWSDNWDSEPTMEKLVVCGVSEDDDVVNTMDTCKPRSLADVIYRSAYFVGTATKDRAKLARMVDYAVRILWHRTGAGLDAFAPRRTHSEALNFIDRHPKLLDCVRHIYEESGTGKLQELIGLGYASGLMYLMSCSATDPADYREEKDPNEKQLDFSRWELACEFWVLIAGGEVSMKPIRLALATIIDDEGGSIAERCGLLANAWNCLTQKQNLTEKRLALEYEVDEEGFRTLIEHPSVGGIDYGDPSTTIEQKPDDPTEEEIANRATEEREKKETAKKKKAPKAEATEETETAPKKKKSKAKGRPDDSKIIGPLALVNCTMWIDVDADEPYQAKVLSIHGDRARIEIATGHKGAGNSRMVAITELLEKQPV